jgi:hypothetical protein
MVETGSQVCNVGNLLGLAQLGQTEGLGVLSSGRRRTVLYAGERVISIESCKQCFLLPCGRASVIYLSIVHSFDERRRLIVIRGLKSVKILPEARARSTSFALRRYATR